MNTHITTDHSELIERVAEQFVTVVSSAIRNRGHAIVGVVGGRSIVQVYHALAERGIDFSNIHFFMLDERLVSLTSDDSNYKLLYDSLSSQIPEANLHPYDCTVDTPESYYERFKVYGDSFDLVLLGSGEDGHIASLFPNHDSIKDDSIGYLFVSDSPKPPSDRVTVSRKLLEISRSAAVLFLGEAKRSALERFNNPSTSVDSCPVKIVHAIPDLHVYTDLS